MTRRGIPLLSARMGHSSPASSMTIVATVALGLTWSAWPKEDRR